MMSITLCLLLLALAHVNAITREGTGEPGDTIPPAVPRAHGDEVIKRISLLPGEENVSQSTIFDGHKAEYAIDENMRTFSQTSVNSTEPPYLFIDLQKYYYVDHILIYNLNNNEYPLQDLLITVDDYVCQNTRGTYSGQLIKVPCKEPVEIGRTLRITMKAKPTRTTYVNKKGDEIVGYNPEVHSKEMGRWPDGEAIKIEEYDQILSLSEVQVFGHLA